VGTVIADDPQLTCRIAGGRNPWRIILDPRLRIPLASRLLRHHDREKNIIVTGQRSAPKKIRTLESQGAQVWRVKLRHGKIPWRSILRALATRGALSVMIEGGPTTAAWALRDRAVDKVLFFYAPIILGGDGRAMIDQLDVKRVRQALHIKDVEVRKSGADTLVSGYL
jgi:diaminohydroxyphosphoribosylaminopyrimidine deaminase/5-amino-6-(5-phosphoribosylamino)uracil reductase